MYRKPVLSVLVSVLLFSAVLGAGLVEKGVEVTSAVNSGQGFPSGLGEGSVDWWPMFHHDLTHTGYSTSAAPNTNQILWSYTTGIAAWSSPAVADGVAYIGSGDGSGYDKVYALSASTGALVWSYTTGSIVASSPAVADGRVYVGSWDGKVYALNASTGAFIWSYTIGSGWGQKSSPAVASGIVYVGSDDGKVYAFGPPLPSVSISPTSVVMDVGQSQLFTSSVSGGTSPYSYQWYLNSAPVPGATSATWTFTPVSAGSYNVYANVTDNSGITAKSNVASVVVHSAPSVTISPTTVALDVGQSQLFTSTVSGGTSPYSYQWYLNGDLVSGATGTNWTFAPTSTGSYMVYVNVTDDVGAQAISDTANVTVRFHDVAVTNVTSSKTVVGQGYSLTINVTIENQSETSETFNVTLYANATSIASQTVSLTIGNSTTITFTWDTSGFAMGNYTIWAYATPIPGEIQTADNTLANGSILVTIPGDVDGDLEDGHYDVDLFDAVKLLACYGAKEGDSNFDPNCDIDGSGQVFLFDAVILLSRYGQKYP